MIVYCVGIWNDPDDGTHIHRICQAGNEAHVLPPARARSCTGRHSPASSAVPMRPRSSSRTTACGSSILPVLRDRAEAGMREDRPATIDRGAPVALLERAASGKRIRVEGPLPLLPQVRLQIHRAEQVYDARWRHGRELGLRLAA